MRSLMLALVLAAGPTAAWANDSLDPSPEQLPNAIKVKGPRPKSNPEALPPAATSLPADLDNLAAPAPLALPTNPAQVRIVDYRPLKLREVERLIEVNSPQLKAIASQVEQAKSNLRAQISAWYPTLSLSTDGFPSRSFGSRTQNYGSDIVTPNNPYDANAFKTQTQIYGAGSSLKFNWDLINPQRVPQIAAARDQFEKAKNQYLITLRELRLQAATAYFNLQNSDDQVRIGKSAVQSSSVNLRDARARLQAGVATKLDVMEAETQLARDQQKLTDGLLQQSIARRDLARLLDLPQNITPTSADPSTLLGVWQPSLQESIVAAYAFREELSNLILDVSIANSNANSSLGNVQPFLSIFGTSGWDKTFGQSNVAGPANMGLVVESLYQNVGLNLKWNIFDGGKAAAQARQQRQLATENTYKFSTQRDAIRYEVEQAYFSLQAQIRNLITTSRQVLSTRESLRLARLRFQAGVGTQRNVVDSQRDATTAEVAYSDAVSKYNTNVAQLQRRTGLDRVLRCTPPQLPTKPTRDPITDVPVIPVPTNSPCLIQAAPQ
ncbi:MAG: TolC family protein [Synechococcaceae bacterium WBA_2_066]|nr:TolC family protein [Synechococcaceae bacterium WB5_2B_268]NBY59712.1 TolC family protein [Synechococcaceae bacterium LLD_019]NDC06178.1 TolC family protein [Synechococcaceae bacterium WB9_2_069]NDE37327.1 TolC family protein [Synechococcaceae bacterium WBA_2_066]